VTAEDHKPAAMISASIFKHTDHLHLLVLVFPVQKIYTSGLPPDFPALPEHSFTGMLLPLPDLSPSTPPVVPSRTASPAVIGNSGVAPPPLPRRVATRGVSGPAATTTSTSV
jgi:hypothetical protein